MEALNYSAVRNQLKSVLDKVCENHTPTIITRRNGKSVVLLSLEDFNSYEETAYLLRGKNGEVLKESINQLEFGHAKQQKLVND